MLKILKFLIWLVLLPVRGVLFVLSILLKGVRAMGSIVTTIIGILCLFVVIGSLMFAREMITGSQRWIFLGIGVVVMSLPYVAEYLSELMMDFAQFLGECTSPFNE